MFFSVLAMLAALGCILYRRRWAVIIAWALLVLVAVPLAPHVFQVLDAGGFTNDRMQASQADDLLANHFHSDPSSLYVVYQDPSGALTADDPRFEAEIRDSLAAVAQLPSVAGVVTPDQNPRQIAPDHQAAYAVVALTPSSANTQQVFSAVQAAVRPTDLQVTITGAPVLYADIYNVTERDLRRAEEISFPFAGVALLVVFGSVVAAALPAAIGGTAVAVALAGMVILSRVTSLSIFSLNLTTMLGLGLGIDYSLFIVSRYREELARGAAVDEAVAQAVATAGRSVLFSGMTVFIGLLALLLFDFEALRSLGIAGSLVVAVDVLAALTLLPALLSVIGTRIDALSLMGLVHRLRPARHSDQPGFWARLAAGVMAHPLAVFLTLMAFLLALGIPFLHVQLGAPDASILPTDVQSRRGFDLLRQHWGAGELSPVLLVFQTTDGGSPLRPDDVGALNDFVRRLQVDPSVARVDSVVSLDPRVTRAQYQVLYDAPDVSQIGDTIARAAAQASVRGDTVLVTATSLYGQTDPRSTGLIRSIRATPPPPGFRLVVGGATAATVDYADLLYARFPAAAVLVVAAIYLILLISFQSVILPLKAIFMNALSIVASFGALVAIFQDGDLSSFLGFQPLGFVEASLPIVMFCVLFGLSMDYEVFLLSRIKEAHDRGMDNTSSVALGLQRSGRIVTSAAGIVVLVSLSFAAADIVLIKALGLGTAIAVLLDATIVRALLVPATMRLLGHWNWWAPAWLLRVLPKGYAHGA